MAPRVDTEDLVDAQGVARILGLAHRNTVSVYQRRYRDMPRPIVNLGAGRAKLWSRSEMERWAAARRSRGRRRRRAHLLPVWDWRFRVAFSHEVRHQVRRSAAALERVAPKVYADRFRALAQLSEQTVSVGALVQAIETDRDKVSAMEQIELASSKPVLGIPPGAERYLAAAIDRLADWLPKTGVRALRELLHRGRETVWRNPHRGALEIVFGDRLAEVLDYGRRLQRQAPRRHPRGTRLSDREFELEAERILENLKAGNEFLPRFELEITSGDGFGEYWPVELRAEPQDALRLFRNPDARWQGVLHLTLIHEVLGHALFYEFLRRARSPWCDHGAVALIEGWATWAEWRLHPARIGPDQATLSWLELLDVSAGDAEGAVRQVTRRQGYSEARALRSLVSFSQFPAYQLSYVLGALWFDLRAEGRAGPDVLFELDGEPLGDFLFAL